MLKSGVNSFKLSDFEVQELSRLNGLLGLPDDANVKQIFLAMSEVVCKPVVDQEPQTVEVEKIVEKIIEKIPEGHIALPVSQKMKYTHGLRAKKRKDYTMEKMVDEAVNYCCEQPEGTLFTKKW